LVFPRFHGPVLAGCQTSDATLRDQGRSEAYVTGYEVNQEVDKTTDFNKIGKKALKDVDASTLKSLEKD